MMQPAVWMTQPAVWMTQPTVNFAVEVTLKWDWQVWETCSQDELPISVADVVDRCGQATPCHVLPWEVAEAQVMIGAVESA